MNLAQMIAPNGMQGVGKALQTFSPLALAMAQGIRSGQGAQAFMGQGLASMMAQEEARKAEVERKQAMDMTSGMLSDLMAPSPVPNFNNPFAGVAEPNSPQGIATDAMVAVGRRPDAGGLPESLIRTESGGRFSAKNDVPGAGGVGHFGRGQFSRARLSEAQAAGVIPAGMSPEQFLANPDAQVAVERWHVADIGRFIRDRGLDQYIGQTINGVTITPNGMLAVAHLGGKEGLRRFLESGGQYNPSDAFGTSLLDYAATHGGGGRAPQIDPQRAAAVLASPNVPDAVKQLVLSRMQPPAAPEPTSGMREYELAVSQGFQGSFLDYQNALAEARREQTNVNVNTGAEVDTRPIAGAPPAGFQRRYDEARQSWVDEPIPGGKEDTTETKEAQVSAARTASDVITTAAERALEAARGRNMGAAATSLVGRLPWTDSAEVMRQVAVLQSNATVENLNAMREQSPTGGALGSITEKENQMLAEKSGALDPNSPNFERDLADYTRTLLRIVHGDETGDLVFKQVWPQTGEDGLSESDMQWLNQ